MLIYTTQNSPRLQYTLDFIFKEINGISYDLTTDWDFFVSYYGIKINYSNNLENNQDILCINIMSCGLLFETTLREDITIEVGTYHELPILFFEKNSTAAFPFDLFSAVFYLISRYEEYGTTKVDKHGRYQAENSIAYKYNFLHRPIVNYYIQFLVNSIKTIYPNFKTKISKFTYLPTIDVDVAYEIKASNYKQHILSIFKLILRLKVKRLFNYILIIGGKANDPNDTFSFIEKIHTDARLSTLYFILFTKNSGYDINNSITNPVFKKLLVSLSKKTEIGIHPSYASFLKARQVKKEINELSFLINKEVIKSRNHFLRIKIPETYQNLSTSGIKEDYTMGYASQPGFRAGTCHSFYFYDLTTNQPTNLRVHPFMYMDGTFFNYLKVTPAVALNTIIKLVDETVKFKGQFISLWHNNTLADNEQFSPWRIMYIKSLKYITDQLEKIERTTQNG